MNQCTEDIVYSYLKQGALIINIDGSAIQLYASGIITETCSSKNQGAILVGYGIDPTSGQEFWKVRNSWGSSWGEDGYIRVARNPENNDSCFITKDSYLVKSIWPKF
jgi:C1A family cysteine protease